MADITSAVSAVIAALENNLDGAYEAAIGIAQEARETGDAARWHIGDIAACISTAYGKDHLGAFAKDVNVPKKTVYEYARTAAVIDRETRANYEMLAWTHFRLAARIEQNSARAEYLERAANEAWTADEAAREYKLLQGAKPPPAIIWNADMRVVAVNAATGVITLQAVDAGGDTYALQDAMRAGKPVKVKIIEIIENEVTG